MPFTGSAGGGSSSGSTLLLTSNGTAVNSLDAAAGCASLAVEAAIDIAWIGPCLLATSSSAVKATAATTSAAAPPCRNAPPRAPGR